MNTKEIAQNIFSLNSKNVNLTPDLQEDTISFIKELLSYFPKDSKIRHILKELKIQSFSDVISKYFKFPIISPNLEKISCDKINFKKQGVFEIYSLYTFYTWVSLNNLFLKAQKQEFSILLSILNNIILNSSNDQKRNQYHVISVFCFIDIINVAVTNDIIDNYDLIFSEVTEFFSENENLPPDSNIIIEILSNKILLSKNNFSIGLINSITQILYRNPKILNPQTILNIVKITKNYIIKLEDIYVKFFLNVANYIPINDFKKVFKPLMIQLLTNIAVNFHDDEKQEKESISTKPLKTKKCVKNDNIFSCLIFNPPPDLYQINNVDDEDEKTIIQNFEIQKLSNFISLQNLQVISMVEKIIVLNVEYAQYFLTESFEDLQMLNSSLDFMENDEKDIFQSKKIFYDQCATVFCLVSTALKQFPKDTIKISDEMKLILFNNKQIFNPNVTFFNQDSNFEIINSLRHFIFQFLFDKFQNSLIKLLKDNSIYLDLFHECIYRLFYMLRNETNQTVLFKFSMVSDFLITTLYDLQISLDPPYMDDDENSLILIIRKTILHYLIYYLNNESLLVPSFSSSVFIKYFFILLFEPPIRTKFINYLFKYLMVVTAIHKDILYSNITQVFSTACMKLSQEEALSLLIDILNTFNESLLKNKMLIDVFEPISADLFNIIINSDIIKGDLEQIEDIFLSLILFLNATYKGNEKQFKNISLLESTIFKHVQNNTNNKVMLKFAQIITGNNQSTDSLPIDEIKQPKILCSFIRVFLETEKINGIVKYILDLCAYSVDNCNICHEIELDFLIIDIIAKLRKSEEEKNKPKSDDDDENKKEFIISEELVDLLFDLLSQIAAITSSIQVVYRFFSLLRPINSKYLPSFHKSAINCLNQILINSKNYPPASLPMHPLNMIEIKDIPIKSIEEGFSFVFWISIPSLDNFIHNIINLNEDKNHDFSVKLIEKKIRVKIISGDEIDNFDIPLDIPIKKWSMITCTLIPDHYNKISHTDLYIGEKQFKPILNLHLFSPKTKIKCLINHSESQKNELPLMGPFYLTKPLSITDVSSLLEDGIRPSLNCIKEKVIFAYTPQYLSDYVILEPLQKLNRFDHVHDEILINNKQLSFADLMVHHCELSLILPIFGQLDSTLSNGEPVNIDDLRLDILTNLFKLGEQFQQSFYISNGFHIISHHFHNSNKSHISLHLYETFYNLLETISCKNLQIQLIDNIIMNIDLWSELGYKDQAKIFNNWNQKIYTQFKSIVDSIRTIEWFLFVIHRYYDPLNQQDQTLFFCRKFLLDIASETYKTKFSQSDFSIIIGLIGSNETPLIEKKDMISLLVSVLQNDEIIKENKINVSQIIPYIFIIYDFNFKDNEIIEQIVYLIIIIYKLKKYEMQIPLHTLIQNIIIALHINQNYFYPENIFKKLISLINLNNAIEFLPMLCVNAIYGGLKYLDILINNIQRNINYFNFEQSTIYPSLSLFIFYSNEYYYQKLIKLFIDLFNENLDMLINAIDIIGNFCFQQNLYESVKHDVLYGIIKIFTNQTKFDLNIIFKFIFLRPNISKSSILNHFINQLPLDSYNPCLINLELKTTENKKETKNEINLKINEKIQKNLESTEFKLKIGLRFNDTDGKWLDLDITKALLLAIQNFHILESSDFFSILINFINECDSSFDSKSFEDELKDIKIIYKNDINSILEYTNVFTIFNSVNLTNESVFNYAQNFILFYNSCQIEYLYDKEIYKNLAIKHKMFNNKLISRNNKRKKIWSTLWDSLKSSESPWSDSFSKDYKSGNLFDESNYFIDEEDEKFHKFIRNIGEGTKSKLTLIFDTRTQKIMCKKVLKVSENINDFRDLKSALREFEVLHFIHHPCICHAIGINISEIIRDEKGNEMSTVALFMEFIELNLDVCLKKKILDNTIKTKIIIEIAQAMSFIHKLGMIHKDLKIDNIMLDSNYNTKLINFDCVDINEFLFSDNSITSDFESEPFKKSVFMSPEMLEEKDYDKKTDVYSFGVVLYYIFFESLPNSNLDDIIKRKPIQLPKQSPLISQFGLNLISKCLDFNPKKRPSFNDILLEIRKHSYLLTDDVDQSVVSSRDQELEEIKLPLSK